MPGATPVGGPQNGNGDTLRFNTGSLAGNTSFGVLAVDTATGCSTQVSDTVSVTVAAMPVIVSLDLDQRTCPASGNNWVTFASLSGNRAIVSVNPNGNNLGNVTATSFVNDAPININACTDAQSVFTTTVLNRRWTITPTTQPASAVDVRLYFTQAEFDALMEEANLNQNLNDDVNIIPQLRLTKYNGLNENSSFADNCGHGVVDLFSPTASGNVPDLFMGFDFYGRYVQFSIPSFSEFWLHGSSSASPLPIVLSGFKATCADEKVRIDWVTSSEINNSFFTLYRSRDAVNWETVTTLPGAGNSNKPLAYSHTDYRPFDGISYYRLQQTDHDGKSKTFDPTGIHCGAGAEEPEWKVFPNPMTDILKVSIVGTTPENNVPLLFYDVNGKVCFSQNVQIDLGLNEWTIDCTILSAGTYFVHVKSATATFKPVKLVVSNKF